MSFEIIVYDELRGPLPYYVQEQQLTLDELWLATKDDRYYRGTHVPRIERVNETYKVAMGEQVWREKDGKAVQWQRRSW